MRLGIVKSDGEITSGHEFVDDAVDGGEELLEVFRSASLLGDAIQSGTEIFGALTIGNVAIDEVEGGAAAVDDQGSGREGNIQQGSIAVAALGFESKLFAPLQALRDPVRFGGAIRGKDQRVNGLR